MIASAVEQVLNKLNITLNVDGEAFGKASVKTINNAPADGWQSFAIGVLI